MYLASQSISKMWRTEEREDLSCKSQTLQAVCNIVHFRFRRRGKGGGWGKGLHSTMELTHDAFKHVVGFATEAAGACSNTWFFFFYRAI